MSLELKYRLLLLLVEWDPAVVSATTGEFIISRVASRLKITKPQAKGMISSLKEHLALYVDDLDFCHNIKWATNRIKHVSQ